MSQEKVDKYKEQKLNRKKIMRREKIMSIIRRTGLALVVLALLGWLGYSGYTKYEASIPRTMTEVNYTAVNNYMSSLADTETDEATADEAATDEAAQ